MSALYIYIEDASEDFADEEIILPYFFACPNIGELVQVYYEDGHRLNGRVKSVKFSCYSTDPLNRTVTLVLKRMKKLKPINFYDPGDGDGNHPVFKDEWSICNGGDYLVLTFYKDNYRSFLGQTIDDLPPNVGWIVDFQDENGHIHGKVIERVWLINSEDWNSWEIAILLDDVSTG
jgi:hypothetical protein